MCPNCCDLESNCDCDDTCRDEAIKIFGTEDGVQCAMPYQQREESSTWFGSVLKYLVAAVILLLCLCQVYRTLVPKPTPAPWLMEDEMTEDVGSTLQNQGRSVMLSSGG